MVILCVCSTLSFYEYGVVILYRSFLNQSFRNASCFSVCAFRSHAFVIFRFSSNF